MSNIPKMGHLPTPGQGNESHGRTMRRNQKHVLVNFWHFAAIVSTPAMKTDAWRCAVHLGSGLDYTAVTGKRVGQQHPEGHQINVVACPGPTRSIIWAASSVPSHLSRYTRTVKLQNRASTALSHGEIGWNKICPLALQSGFLTEWQDKPRQTNRTKT